MKGSEGLGFELELCSDIMQWTVAVLAFGFVSKNKTVYAGTCRIALFVSCKQ